MDLIDKYLIVEDYPVPGDAIYRYAYAGQQQLYFHASDELREIESCKVLWNDALVSEIPELKVHIRFFAKEYGMKYSVFSSSDNYICDQLFLSCSEVVVSPNKLNKEQLEKILSELYVDNHDILNNLRKNDFCEQMNVDWLYFFGFVRELSFSFFFARTQEQIKLFQTTAEGSKNTKLVSLSDYNDWFNFRNSKKIQYTLNAWPRKRK